MIQSDSRQVLTAILVVAAVTIVAAWGFQLIGGFLPCPLCLKQRWPYYAVIVVTSFVLALELPERQMRIALFLIAALMFASALLGAYHSGVEWKWWPGPQSCSGGAGLSGGLPDLNTARAISCDQAQWRFLALSFAGWNVVISLMMSALALLGARNAKSLR